MRSQSAGKVAGFFRYEVGYQNPIDACFSSFIDEPVQSELQQRVEVTEEDDRNVSLRARGGNDFQDFVETETVTQRAFGSSLNDGPIGHRIAEGHA